MNIGRKKSVTDPPLGRLQARDVQVPKLGEELVNILEVLHLLGLDSDRGQLDGARRTGFTSRRGRRGAARTSSPTLGDRMHGKTCAGTWVTGKGKDGKPREVYLSRVVDDGRASGLDIYRARRSWQTAINPVVGMELLAKRTWAGTGVLGPEAFDPVPFLDLLKDGYNSPWGMPEDR